MACEILPGDGHLTLYFIRHHIPPFLSALQANTSLPSVPGTQLFPLVFKFCTCCILWWLFPPLFHLINSYSCFDLSSIIIFLGEASLTFLTKLNPPTVGGYEINLESSDHHFFKKGNRIECNRQISEWVVHNKTKYYKPLFLCAIIGYVLSLWYLWSAILCVYVITSLLSDFLIKLQVP